MFTAQSHQWKYVLEAQISHLCLLQSEMKQIVSTILQDSKTSNALTGNLKENTYLKASKVNIFYDAAIFRKHKLLQQQAAKF